MKKSVTVDWQPPRLFRDRKCPLAGRRLAMWGKLVELAPAGVLLSLDPALLERAAILQVEIERGGTSPAVFSQLLDCLNALHLTPRSRGFKRASEAPVQ